ncbi:MAG: Holliday junction branch migration protein RuvA [Clostridiales bacterium]|nr:Holliday junction branch migration protein RuvA [Clostridiales bacterium]
MYAYIKGIFESARGENIIVENNGIGYKIYMPLLLQGRIGHVGDQVCVYTYHYVREDAIALYGFPEPEDQDMFELLLTVSGIGPKIAISVVEVLRPAELAMAVISGDVKKLCTVKGLGKKSAERIVLELKDKLKNFDVGDVAETAEMASSVPSAGKSEVEDCISALVVLGYPASEASRAAFGVYEEGKSVEKMIREALQKLAK